MVPEFMPSAHAAGPKNEHMKHAQRARELEKAPRRRSMTSRSTRAHTHTSLSRILSMIVMYRVVDAQLCTVVVKSSVVKSQSWIWPRCRFSQTCEPQKTKKTA